MTADVPPFELVELELDELDELDELAAALALDDDAPAPPLELELALALEPALVLEPVLVLVLELVLALVLVLAPPLPVAPPSASPPPAPPEPAGTDRWLAPPHAARASANKLAVMRWFIAACLSCNTLRCNRFGSDRTRCRGVSVGDTVSAMDTPPHHLDDHGAAFPAWRAPC